MMMTRGHTRRRYYILFSAQQQTTILLLFLLLFFVVANCVLDRMVWSVIQNFRTALKYRGGMWGLLEHMYTVRVTLHADRLFDLILNDEQSMCAYASLRALL